MNGKRVKKTVQLLTEQLMHRGFDKVEAEYIAYEHVKANTV